MCGPYFVKTTSVEILLILLSSDCHFLSATKFIYVHGAVNESQALDRSFFGLKIFLVDLGFCVQVLVTLSIYEGQRD